MRRDRGIKLDAARFRVGLKDVPRKQRVNIMLDTGVVGAFKAKAGDRGYQTLINEALKQYLTQDVLVFPQIASKNHFPIAFIG